MAFAREPPQAERASPAAIAAAESVHVLMVFAGFFVLRMVSSLLVGFFIEQSLENVAKAV